MAKKRILLVEDDPILSKGLAVNFSSEGYSVVSVNRLGLAIQEFEQADWDLVVLDLGLPDGDGLDLCRHMRKGGSLIPVIILTAKIDEETVVKALNCGANDYVRKPFGHRELLARVAAALRTRTKIVETSVFGSLTLDCEKRLFYVGAAPYRLQRREFDILALFMAHPERVMTRVMLLDQLEMSDDTNDRTIDSHISHLRHKLKNSGCSDAKIKSEYGLGYRLTLND